LSVQTPGRKEDPSVPAQVDGFPDPAVPGAPEKGFQVLKPQGSEDFRRGPGRPESPNTRHKP